MSVRETVHALRLASPALAASTLEERNAFLAALSRALEVHKDEVFAANREDMADAQKQGLAATVQKRLRYDEGKLQESLAQLSSLEQLSDPAYPAKGIIGFEGSDEDTANACASMFALILSDALENQNVFRGVAPITLDNVEEISAGMK